MNKRINTGDVFICDFGKTKGSMQGGIRPCIIVDNYMACIYSPCIHCVPLTTTNRQMKLHYEIKEKNCDCLVNDSIALCEQYTLIDKSQLLDKVGSVNRGDLANITELCKQNLPFTY